MNIAESQLTLAFLLVIKMKYKIGQYVYTAKNIRGWFDFSTKDYIPENTVGKIVSIGAGGDCDPPFYTVEFSREFGLRFVLETDLKLG